MTIPATEKRTVEQASEEGQNLQEVEAAPLEQLLIEHGIESDQIITVSSIIWALRTGQLISQDPLPLMKSPFYRESALDRADHHAADEVALHEGIKQHHGDHGHHDGGVFDKGAV